MRSLRDGIERTFQSETLRGPEVTRGSLMVTPVARSLRVGGGGGVFVRTWPSAVLVSEGGRTSRLPIIDVTRWAQVAILLVALLWVFHVWTRTRTRKERS